MTPEHRSCQHALALAREALTFYADRYNYRPDIADVVGVNHYTGTMEWGPSPVEEDDGYKAQQALKQIALLLK